MGSNAAFALQCAGIVTEIQILDANTELAEGEALDLLHGTSAIADQLIYSGDYESARDSDIFIITAGLRRKPDESRLDLINRNVSLFSQILASMKETEIREESIVFCRLESRGYLDALGDILPRPALEAGVRVRGQCWIRRGLDL